MKMNPLILYGLFLKNRRAIRRERILRDRQNPLEVYDDSELLKRFGFRRHQLQTLYKLIQADLEQPVVRGADGATHTEIGYLPGILQLCAALRFYTTGVSHMLIGDTIGVHESVSCKALERVTLALLRLLPQYVKLPTQEEADVMKQHFYGIKHFPDVFGCVDGAHIRIQAPETYAHEFVNHMQFHSINIMVICDVSLRFINISARWPGSVHDARVLRNTHFFDMMEKHPKVLKGVILGDGSYMLRDWLMKPVARPSTPSEESYNEALCETRQCVVRAVQELKKRFACLNGELQVDPSQACRIIVACLILHNMAIKHSLTVPDVKYIPVPDSDSQLPSLVCNSDRERTQLAKQCQERLIDKYFGTEGSK